MAFSNPKLEARIQQLGGKKPTSSTGSAPQNNTRTSTFSNPQLESRITQIYQTPVKKVAQKQPVKIAMAQPQKPATLLDQVKGFVAKIPAPANIPGQLYQAVKSIDYDRVKKNFEAGVKSTPGQLKVAGGILTEGWAKQQKQMNSFFGILPDNLKPFFGNPLQNKITEVAANKAEVVSPQLREQGTKGIRKAQEPLTKLPKTNNPAQVIADAIALNLPQMAVSTGLTVATGLLTKNPLLARAVGLSTSYGLGASEVYNEARNNNLTDRQALPYAMLGGTVIAALDFGPLDELIKKSGAVKQIEKKIVKRIASGIVGAGEQAAYEGATEGLQELIGNAIRSTYSDNKDLFEGVGLSTVVGIIMGGGSNVALDGVLNITQKGKTPEQVTNEINDKIEKVLNTPESKRTPEEKILAKELLTVQVTPDEALDIVTTQKIEGTPEGKEIVMAVAQAKEQGKEIRIVSNDNRDIESIDIVDPYQTPKQVEVKSIKETFKKVLNNYENSLNGGTKQEMTPEENQMLDEYYEFTVQPEIMQKQEEGYTEDQLIDEFLVYREGKRDAEELKVAEEEDAKNTAESPQNSGKKEVKVKPQAQIKQEVDNEPQLIKTKTQIKKEEERDRRMGARKYIIRTRESTAINENLTSQFLELGQKSETPEEYEANIKKLLDDTLAKAKGDKTVLSGMRAALVNELTRASGSSERDPFDVRNAAIEAASQDEFMGGGIRYIQKIKDEIDARLPEAREVPAMIEKVVNLKNKEQKTRNSKEVPVGEGDTKKSRLYERIAEGAEQEIRADLESRNVTYNELGLKEQAEKVAALIENNPVRATEIAQGKVEPPSGMTQNAVAMGLFEVAVAKKDSQTMADLLTSTSLRSTRLGQEIVSLRGKFSGSESLNAVHAILATRMERVIKQYDSILKTLSIPDSAPTIKKVDAIVKHEKAKLSKEFKARQKKMQSAQDIINQLMCK